MTKPVDFLIRLSAAETHGFRQIPVLLEDEHLLALDKPSCLLTSPDRNHPQRPDLMKLLHRGIACGAAWARARGLTYLANTHRLDFDTSGVLLLAKDKPTLIALANQFGAESAARRYIALVRGAPVENAFEVTARLAPHPTRGDLMRVDARQGKRAETFFEVLERFSAYTLLKCRMQTGRYHQIRAHLLHAGFPIVGDSLYAGRPLLLSMLKPEYRFKPGQRERPLMGRAALHAESLDILHPATSARVAIMAPWPKDLTVALKYLRRYASGR